MSFYPAKGGSQKLAFTKMITLSIPVNGDTVIDVKSYAQNAKNAVGIIISVAFLNGAVYGGYGTFTRDHSNVVNTSSVPTAGMHGKVSFSGTKIHVLQVPTAGDTSVTQKVTCNCFLEYTM